MSFARVIPLLRTPFGVDVFDYAVPESMALEPGDLVRVPFRRREIIGVVEALSKTSRVAQKTLPVIGRYADIRFPKPFLELLEYIAHRSFSSKATVLKSWLRFVPKRVPESFQRKNRHKSDGTLSAHWSLTAESDLVTRAKKALREQKSVLVLTPWKTRVELFKERIGSGSVLHSEISDGETFRAWADFLNGKTSCVISTRLGAWLAPMADLVLIDEPENDDHKQDELSPRYDARQIAAWASRFAKIEVESFGLTPSLHTKSVGPTIDIPFSIHTFEPHGYSVIPMIQADALEKLETTDRPITIIHPIKGISARLVCRDCGWRALCEHCGFPLLAEADRSLCRQCGKKYPLPLACPLCGGADLGKSWPGIEKLKRAWNKLAPEKIVDWRTLALEDLERPLAESSYVFVTDSSMLGGVSEDIRRRERQWIAFRRLANRVRLVHGELAIQCHAEHAYAWSLWLTEQGLAGSQEQERNERRLFQYPPSIRVVKIIFEDQESHLPFLEQELRDKIRPQEIRGPFSVAYRPKSRKQRFIYHLIFPPNETESLLLDRLTPFAGRSIIDLDPIAFFR
ncbi:MAG TPA: hypothetical protein VFQ60_05335 [Patescibacteria group bacterium]|nr:hypothetical protein [Patescibacteria group bacterium]